MAVGLHPRALVAGFPPPARTFPRHRSAGTAGPAELYAKLLLLKHRAQQVSALEGASSQLAGSRAG